MEKPKILLVDDEVVIQRLCEKLLGRMGLPVTTAGTVKEAAEKMQASSMDLLITDLKLPDGDGVDVINHFRSRFPNKKVMIITGSPSPEGRLKQAADLGASQVLYKPFEIQDFKEILRQTIEEN